MSLRFLTAACSALICTSALAAPAADPAKADLSRKLEVGQSHRFALLINSSMNLTSPELPGFEQKQEVTQAIDFQMTVKEIAPETGCTLEVKYETVKFTIDSANLQGSFDSATPADEDAENEAAPALRPVVGIVLTVKVDASGKVTEVAGGDALGGLDFWSQVAKQFAEREIVASFIEPAINTRHSGGEAAVGETWTYTDALEESPLGSFRIITNHTLDAVKDDEANISLTGKVETVPVAKEPAADGPEPAPEGDAAPAFEIKNSRNDGAYVWDTKAGVLKSLTQNQAVSMTTAMQGMTMHIDNKTSLTLTRK